MSGSGVDGSLRLFAALQFAWVAVATIGLWTDVRFIFGAYRPDEQVFMFGITLAGTLVSLWLSRVRAWRCAPALIAISAGLHFALYFLPLFLMMGAPMNIFALSQISLLVLGFALAYGCVILFGLFLFRPTSMKGTAT